MKAFLSFQTSEPIRPGVAHTGSGAVNEISARLFPKSDGNQDDAMEAVFASMADGVVVFDGEGHVQHTNPRLCEMFGFDPAAKKLKVTEFLPDTGGDGRAFPPGRIPSLPRVAGRDRSKPPPQTSLLEQEGIFYPGFGSAYIPGQKNRGGSCSGP